MNLPGCDAGVMRAAADVLRGSTAGVRFEATDDCPWRFAMSRSIQTNYSGEKGGGFS